MCFITDQCKPIYYIALFYMSGFYMASAVTSLW